jgi:hypothetical protein
MAHPVGSATTPEIEPVIVWAFSPTTTSARKTSAERNIGRTPLLSNICHQLFAVNGRIQDDVIMPDSGMT